MKTTFIPRFAGDNGKKNNACYDSTYVGFAALLFFSLQPLALGLSAAPPPTEVQFFGEASSPISSAVALPAGRALFFTSGTVPPVLDEKAAAGSRERFGDTKTQAVGTLKRIEAMLHERGLAMRDVIYLRVYLTVDKAKDNAPDYKGWFEAYGQFFGTKENPTKPARSTLGVASLVNPDWLIEIEAVAAYPEK